MWAITADLDEFTEAVEGFRKRVPITRELAGKVNGFTHARGVTIAGVAQLDIVQDVHTSIAEAIRKGTPFEEWKRAVEPKLTAAWGRKDSPRLETIFRNATMQAYNAGRREQMLQPDVVRFRPFWMFDGVVDSRTTQICKECDGTILPYDDPWWATHTPQLHHRCRSAIRNLRKTDADRRGVTQVPPVIRADKGFGLPPDVGEPWRPELTKYSAGLARTYEAKAAALQAVPGTTLTPTGVLRAKGQEFSQALELQDGGKRARELLREQIQQSFPGAQPRSFIGSSILESHTDLTDPNLVGANGYFEPIDKKIAGRIVIRRSRVKASREAARKLAKGQTPGATEIDALRTIIHEELHGHSRVAMASYRGYGAALEEVGNELAARKVLGDLVPALTQKRLRELGVGTYQAQIDKVVRVVRVATGDTTEAATGRVLAAHHREVLGKPGHFTNQAEALEAFLDGLDVTPGQRQNIHTSLIAAF